MHTSADVSIRQHTSAYVSIRQHTSAHASIREHTRAVTYAVASSTKGVRSTQVCACVCVSVFSVCLSVCLLLRQHTSAYVSIRHTSACVSSFLL